MPIQIIKTQKLNGKISTHKWSTYKYSPRNNLQSVSKCPTPLMLNLKIKQATTIQEGEDKETSGGITTGAKMKNKFC